MDGLGAVGHTEGGRNGSKRVEKKKMTDLFVEFGLLACFEPENASVQIYRPRVLCETGFGTTETPVDGVVLLKVRWVTDS